MNDPFTRSSLSVLKIIRNTSEKTQESHMLSETIKLLLLSVSHMPSEDTTKMLLLPVASEKYTFYLMISRTSFQCKYH